MSEGECHCSCHNSEGHMAHCMPCCAPCPHCGRNISNFPLHEKSCPVPRNVMPVVKVVRDSPGEPPRYTRSGNHEATTPGVPPRAHLEGWKELNTWAYHNNPTWAATLRRCQHVGLPEDDTIKMLCAALLSQNLQMLDSLSTGLLPSRIIVETATADKVLTDLALQLLFKLIQTHPKPVSANDSGLEGAAAIKLRELGVISLSPGTFGGSFSLQLVFHNV